MNESGAGVAVSQLGAGACDNSSDGQITNRENGGNLPDQQFTSHNHEHALEPLGDHRDSCRRRGASRHGHYHRSLLLPEKKVSGC